MALAKLIGRSIGKKIVNKYKDESKQIDFLVQDLSASQKRRYENELAARKKSLTVGYLFWCVWCHYGYTGKWFKQVMFWATLGGLFGWWMMDAFLMFFVVDSYNRKVSMEILQKLFEESVGESSRFIEPDQAVPQEGDAKRPSGKRSQLEIQAP